jgi:SAM-dependent methyltransferase
MADKILKRRKDYHLPLGEQEIFMTPQLRGAIDEAIGCIPAPRESAMALDIGAGECPLRSRIEGLGYLYNSLDISQNSSGTIDFVSRIDGPLCSELDAIPGFDLLILTEVLEHVPDWESAFSNISRLLKVGGHCVITSPFFYMLHEEPYDFWRPTDHAIRFHSEKNGLQILKSRRYGNMWDVAGTLVCSTSVCRKEKTFLALLAMLPVYFGHLCLKFFLKNLAPRNLVDLQGRFYLGNLFVLRKEEGRQQ